MLNVLHKHIDVDQYLFIEASGRLNVLHKHIDVDQYVFIEASGIQNVLHKHIDQYCPLAYSFHICHS